MAFIETHVIADHVFTLRV